MLKNLLLIALGAALVVLILGIVGIAWAQTQTPPDRFTPNNLPYFAGMGRWNGGGMMGRWNPNRGTGFMHEAFLAAIAPKLGLSAEALENELAAGKTLWQIAAEKGISSTEFQSLMLQARKEALSQLVAEGVLTQDQADWMISHMNWMGQSGRGFGGGFAPCHGNGWASPGGRWAPTPTP
jgi:hypothetical protein